MTKPNPPIPPDGSCAECGKPRKLTGLKPLYRRAAEADPFCSSVCARAWHGVSLPESQSGRYEREVWHHGTEGGYANHKCRCEACTEASREARAARRA